jgi:uncharacterized protein YecE (DUF72 family)
MVMGWLRYSPSDFIFSAKLPRVITHDKKLGLQDNIKKDVEAFLELMRPLQLGGKLGCLLVQLPPKYDYNYENLESFFSFLDPLFRYAVEFRNLSWMRKETWSLLKEYKIAYTNVDEPLLPSEVHLTTDFAYFRWHGRGERPWFNYLYSKEELDKWVPKVEDAAERVKKVYGYFNNHFHGYAPENCLYFMEKLGFLSDEQKKAKANIMTKQSQLGTFFS